MRSSLITCAALALAAGCQLVDTGPTEEFKCSSVGDCPSGESCCSDRLCRQVCPITSVGLGSVTIAAQSTGTAGPGSTGASGGSTGITGSTGTASGGSATTVATLGVASSTGVGPQSSATTGGSPSGNTSSATAMSTSGTAGGSTGRVPAPKTACATCQSDSDCLTGLSCAGGYCNSSTQCSATDCKANGFRCDQYDDYCLCMGAPLPPRPGGVCSTCHQDSECIAGLSCAGGLCNTSTQCGATPCQAKRLSCSQYDDYCVCNQPPSLDAGMPCSLCKSDNDCTSGLQCAGGFCNSSTECGATPCTLLGNTCSQYDDYCVCSNPAPIGKGTVCGACRSDNDCLSGLQCAGGFCNSSTECGATPCEAANFTCSQYDDYCECSATACGSPTGSPMCAACVNDGTCAAGLTCVTGHCTSETECGATPCACVGGTCDSNDDACSCP